MFRSLSHEEERQGVTGEVEKTVPPALRVDADGGDKGRRREAGRKDGTHAVYVPHELGVLALHSLGCFECSEHVRPLPCVHGAGLALHRRRVGGELGVYNQLEFRAFRRAD